MDLFRFRKTVLLSIFVVFSIWTGVQTWMVPILFDDGYNYQVAISLAENFTYRTRYEPHHVYGGITTNGIVQYFLAGLLSFFDIDVSRTVALGLIGGFMAVSVWIYSKDSFILWIALLIVWPRTVYASTTFLGEILATSFILMGIYVWRTRISQYRLEDTIGRNLLKYSWNSAFLLTAIFFGLAISTKFLTLFIIPPLIFGFTGHLLSKKTSHSSWKVVFIAGLLSVLLMISAFSFFSIQFFFSLIHSGVHWSDFIEKLTSFIFDLHFSQGVGSSSRAVTLEWLVFTGRNPIVLVLVALSLLLLILRSYMYVFLVLLYAIMLFYGQLNERRMLTLSLLILLVAASEYRGFWIEYLRNKSSAIKHSYLPIFFISCSLLIATHFSGRPLNLISFQKFSLTGADPYFVFCPGRKSHSYSPLLIEKIHQLDGPIVTNGWWQLPEISIRAKRDFFDRMSPSNAELAKKSGDIHFLFDEANDKWPPVSPSLCQDEVFRDKTLVLCKFNTDTRPLDFVGD